MTHVKTDAGWLPVAPAYTGRTSGCWTAGPDGRAHVVTLADDLRWEVHCRGALVGQANTMADALALIVEVTP